MGAPGLALALAACGPVAPAGSPAGPPATADGGFLAAPSLAAASASPGGGVRLEGRAPPDAIVRLLSADGRALGVTADATGAWGVDLPASPQPRMFALSAEAGGRTVRAEGALAVLPAGSAAAALLARAGAASAPAGVAGAGAAGTGAGGAAAVGGVRLATVDFDAGGGLAASGAAPPRAALRLLVDGAPVGTGQADAGGRFGLLSVGAALAPGPHRVRVQDAASAAEAGVDTTPAAPLGDAPFRATATGDGWRLDWASPGGGVQSLVAPRAASRAGR